MYGRDTRFLLSAPIRTEMLGMISDTVQMQRAGWEFSVEYEMAYMRYTVLARHRNARMYAMSAPFDLRFFEVLEHGSVRGLTINFPQVANSMEIVLQRSSMDFRPVDMEPQFVDFQQERMNIEQFGIFATPLARTQEIYVPEESVDELLDRILDLKQEVDPAYARMKHEENMSIEGRPREKFHAQILSIA